MSNCIGVVSRLSLVVVNFGSFQGEISSYVTPMCTYNQFSCGYKSWMVVGADLFRQNPDVVRKESGMCIYPQMKRITWTLRRESRGVRICTKWHNMHLHIELYTFAHGNLHMAIYTLRYITVCALTHGDLCVTLHLSGIVVLIGTVVTQCPRATKELVG